MKTSKVLRKAAHVVLERGLAKGDFDDCSGAVCLIGALNTVETGEARQWCPLTDNWNYIWNVVAWNDSPDTTAEDVASLLYSEAEVCDE